MSFTYAKLFSSITESTIWGEAYGTRLVWITMLAKKDRHGRWFGSLPGLARQANVTLAEAEEAIATLLAPDPYSRTPDNQGRRIEAIDGGWRVLNHEKYREQQHDDDERERKRVVAAEIRARRAAEAKESESRKVAESSGSGAESRQADVDSDADTVKPRSNTLVRRQAAAPVNVRFAEFWAAYPSKVGKKPCLAKWKRSKLDALADTILADIAGRLRKDRRWKEGFIPNPLTYLNQERWNDGLDFAAAAQPATPTSSAHAPANLRAGDGAADRLSAARQWATDMQRLGFLTEEEGVEHIARAEARYGRDAAHA